MNKRNLILGASILLAALIVVLFERDLPAAEVDAKYSNAASRFVTAASGARIHYRDQGRRDGLPVVLIHGSSASLHTWEPWVAILGADYRLITLDLPAHGLTGRVAGDDYSTAAYIGAIDTVLGELGIERFVLGGNSMGGGVTWRYALQQHGRVLAMLLIDASGPASWRRESLAVGADEEERSGPVAFRLLRQPWFRGLARWLDPYPLAAQGARASYNDSPVVTDALIDRYYELTMREGGRAATLARFAQIRGDEEDVDLGELTQPALVMWGAQDALISVAFADRFEATLANARKVIYPELGHIPMEEDPARSAADVRAFLEALAPH
ncbi:MAG: alpha/beta hydrolase [Pseudomonadota bacterium]